MPARSSNLNEKQLMSTLVVRQFRCQTETSAVLDPESLRELLVQMGVQFKPDADDDLRPEVKGDSVIKIFATSQEPDYTLPWQTLDVTDARGSGVVIESGRILTAAHVVAQYTFIEVQKAKDSKRVPARALHICHDADLALIEPLDPSFLKDITPIKIGQMPRRRDSVFVSGYPIGGEELSTTEGVVSRVELQPYSHSLRELLAVTVDAAINSGNSGGPVFDSRGELAGIAFQALEGAENVGHMIPPPVINHFLKGFDRDGDKYQGFPELGIVAQSLENPALRKHVKLPEDKSGILVTRLFYGNSGYSELKDGDVIMEISDVRINNDGTAQHSVHDRGNFQLLIHSHYVGDVVPVKVWRNASEHLLQVQLKPVRELVALSQYLHRPSYFLYNGLLFQPLSTDLLRYVVVLCCCCYTTVNTEPTFGLFWFVFLLVVQCVLQWRAHDSSTPRTFILDDCGRRANQDAPPGDRAHARFPRRHQRGLRGPHIFCDRKSQRIRH